MEAQNFNCTAVDFLKRCKYHTPPHRCPQSFQQYQSYSKDNSHILSESENHIGSDLLESKIE